MALLCDTAPGKSWSTTGLNGGVLAAGILGVMATTLRLQ